MTETLARKQVRSVAAASRRSRVMKLYASRSRGPVGELAVGDLANEAHRIERSFQFRNFQEALAIVQELGEVAETECQLRLGARDRLLGTKKIKGLHENDFVVASKIERCSTARVPRPPAVTQPSSC